MPIVKLSEAQMALVGAKTADEFPERLTAFHAANKQIETVLAKAPDLTALESKISALEKSILPEARISEIASASAAAAVSAFVSGEEGRKVIGAEASRITMEALANVGTQPVKSAPVTADAAPVNKTFGEIVNGLMQAGKSKTEAITAAVASAPAEYQAWVKTGGKL